MKTPSRRITAIVGGMVALVALLVIAYIASRGSCKLPTDNNGYGKCGEGEYTDQPYPYCAPGATTYSCATDEQVCGKQPQCRVGYTNSCDQSTGSWTDCKKQKVPQCTISDKGVTQFPIAYKKDGALFKTNFTTISNYAQGYNIDTIDGSSVCVLDACTSTPEGISMEPRHDKKFCVSSQPREGDGCTTPTKGKPIENATYWYQYKDYKNPTTATCEFEQCNGGGQPVDGKCESTGNCGKPTDYGNGVGVYSLKGSGGDCTLYCMDEKTTTNFTVYGFNGTTSSSGTFKANQQSPPKCVATGCTQKAMTVNESDNKCVADCTNKNNFQMAYDGNIEGILDNISSESFLNDPNNAYQCIVKGPDNKHPAPIGYCYNENPNEPTWVYDNINGHCVEPNVSDHSKFIGPNSTNFRTNLTLSTFFAPSDQAETGCIKCPSFYCDPSVTKQDLDNARQCVNQGKPLPSNPGCTKWNVNMFNTQSGCAYGPDIAQPGDSLTSCQSQNKSLNKSKTYAWGDKTTTNWPIIADPPIWFPQIQSHCANKSHQYRIYMYVYTHDNKVVGKLMVYNLKTIWQTPVCTESSTVNFYMPPGGKVLFQDTQPQKVGGELKVSAFKPNTCNRIRMDPDGQSSVEPVGSCDGEAALPAQPPQMYTIATADQKNILGINREDNSLALIPIENYNFSQGGYWTYDHINNVITEPYSQLKLTLNKADTSSFVYLSHADTTNAQSWQLNKSAGIQTISYSGDKKKAHVLSYDSTKPTGQQFFVSSVQTKQLKLVIREVEVESGRKQLQSIESHMLHKVYPD